MSSIIAQMISSLFSKTEYRCLMVGLDASGKTTILYKMKLGEIVTTIPTIGFNVETLTVNNTNFTVWDVGGCDKIRPLWRHYYQNTQAIIFIVDSNDKQRMFSNDVYSGKYETSADLISTTLNEEELKDAVVLIFFNKQDLPSSMKPEDIYSNMKIDALLKKTDGSPRLIHCQPCCAVKGEGLYEGFTWLENALRNNKQSPGSNTTVASTTPAKVLSPEEEEQARRDSLLIEWLEREDEPDEEFIRKLSDYTLDSWDHYTHLRIAWLMLSQHGRQEGMPLIFSLIKNFIAHSPRTQRSRGTTFHETMTYFWTHMVHYAMVATKLPRNDFKTFLLMNPQLSNGGLFLHYYSKQRMLHDADARIMVLLPDKLPLPSLVSSVDSHAQSQQQLVNGNSAGVAKLVPSQPLTDEQFMDLFEAQRLPGWGHDTKLRLIYLMLCRYGRSSAAVDAILEAVRSMEKADTHITLTYFWIQMVTYHIQSEIKANSAGSASGNAVESVFHAFNNKGYVTPIPTTPVTKPEDITTTAAAEKEITTGVDSLKLSVQGATGTETSRVAAGPENMKFGVFIQLPHCQPLRNQLLYEKYYSRSLIDDNLLSRDALALPNLKPFPKFV